MLRTKAINNLGVLALQTRNYPLAESYFRQVVNEVGHSAERLRGLFGLAFAIEKQKRFAEATRIYQIIDTEYGAMETWTLLVSTYSGEADRFYYPPDVQPEDPSDMRFSGAVLSDVLKYRLQEIAKAQKQKAK
jgi:hypothetical protein